MLKSIVVSVRIPGGRLEIICREKSNRKSNTLPAYTQCRHGADNILRTNTDWHPKPIQNYVVKPQLLLGQWTIDWVTRAGHLMVVKTIRGTIARTTTRRRTRTRRKTQKNTLLRVIPTMTCWVEVVR